MTKGNQKSLLPEKEPSDRQIEMLAVMATGGTCYDRYGSNRVTMRQRGSAERVRDALKSRGCIGRMRPHHNELMPAAAAILKKYQRRIPPEHRQTVLDALPDIDERYATRQAEHDEHREAQATKAEKNRREREQHRQSVVPAALQRIAAQHNIKLDLSKVEAAVAVAFFDDIQDLQP